MSSLKPWSTLARECATATARSEEIEIAMLRKISGSHAHWFEVFGQLMTEERRIPITFSIDNALWLLSKVAPGSSHQVGRIAEEHSDHEESAGAWARIFPAYSQDKWAFPPSDPDGIAVSEGTLVSGCASEALAICASICRYLDAKEKAGGNLA